MCYYGSEYPRFIKKDKGHFNLMADLHVLVRNGQQNLYQGEGGKKKLIASLLKVVENVKSGEYDSHASEPQGICSTSLDGKTTV